MQRTQIANVDDALDVIEHVNQDHAGELKAIIMSLYPDCKIERAELVELFEEGALIRRYQFADTQTEDIFVPFEIKGTLEEKLFQLAYAHSPTEANAKDQFRFLTVTNTEVFTDKFVRLTIRSKRPFPSIWPGLCFSVHLTVLESRSESKIKANWLSKISADYYKRLSVFLLRVLPVSLRRKMIANTRKDVRAYTLRSSWQELHNGETIYCGYIDVFTHGRSKGSVWARKLKPGQVIYTSGDHPDKHAALVKGNNVIFCDETAFPAVAGILEQWQNPQAPTLIIISQTAKQQIYFEHVDIPQDTRIHRIICETNQQADRVIEILKAQKQFDSVWGAMEMKMAKQVRHFLRNQHMLRGENNLVKAYWRCDTENN